MADQEFLVSFGVDIDDSGISRLQAALEKNRQMADQLAAAFDRARVAVQSFFREFSEIPLPDVNLPSARVTEQQEGISLPFSLDFTKATQELNAFFKNAGKAFRLNADGSGIVSAGRNALSQLEALFASTVLPLKIQEEISSDGFPAGSGSAGTIGGTGTLSVLSTLPQRAGDLLASASAASAPVIYRNTDQNVSAPVSIQVTAAAADPEAVGRSVYDVAEQYLLRTLKSTLG